MTPSPGIEPGTHWWKASALTTAPTLLPYLLFAVTYVELPTFANKIKLYSGGYQEWGKHGRVLPAARQNAKGLSFYSHKRIPVIPQSQQ